MCRMRRLKLLLSWAILFFVVLFLIKNRKRRGERIADGEDVLSFRKSSKLLTVDGNVDKNSFSLVTGEGRLNVSVWEEICGNELISLKEFPLFPHAPTSRRSTSTLRIRLKQNLENFGLRIFGFLSPLESGNYNFHLSSSGSTELWISSNTDPEKCKLMGNVTSRATWINDGNTISLSAGKRYYIEILHKHGLQDEENLNFMHIKWRSSAWKVQVFRDIPSDVLIPSEDDQHSNVFGKIKLQSLLNQRVVHRDTILPMHVQQSEPSFVTEEEKRRSEMYFLPFIREEDTKDLFPPCQYNPSYIVKNPLGRYQSMWETHYTSIYPHDHADIMRKSWESDDFVTFGNDQMDENAARKIVVRVWTQLQVKSPRKYTLKHILNVEENHDPEKGDRYLVELELIEILSRRHLRFSEYVYRPKESDTLCSPVAVAWNKSAVVNILLATGNNQGRWTLHFLDHMSRIHNKTKDFNFNVIIVEFDGIYVDLKEALKKSGIPHYRHIRLRERFQKARGLQLAANMVTNPNSIVFVMDLHLDIPYHFLDDVRKHCVQGKIAYSPLLTRLSCGATARHPRGYWEDFGYGLMGMYKSDWNRIGGMNVKEFKNKWGGEDWEICDRILMTGMEIERLKMVHLFHYYHTRKGMWSDVRNDTDVSEYAALS
ncbi:N-acetyl-beta-glucosaminyl-glycoprotein 4-beta-N-acetylgalactosaminyltransferase 1-like [Stylophora pistillata]|uniref:N-acetyl-beta-glucosaminyl-glycoprotein 4-beta-N-acetylgalactosaminyltransferase 1-like n=1 Tax=Stylophora pistillata TaxID=50429 RepID=UPI000C050632|nr:N-acetyl-beta-glucosaminyl-glycoprotein 4-beta-N-acetylgalactosaminyltransferase 1-like [Stylophora pistillata]